MKRKLAVCLLVAAALCYGGSRDIKDLLVTILDSRTDADLPKLEQFDSVISMSAINALSASEVQEITPLMRKCLESPRLEVRREGLWAVTAISLRPDSSALLEPVIDDIEGLARDPASPLKLGALYVLGSTYPRPSQKAVSYLQRHLADKSNSSQQLITITVSLMQATAPGSPLWQKVIDVVEKQADPGVKTSVLQEIGNERASDSTSQAFMKESLDDENPYIRKSAVDSAGKLDPSTRMNFLDRLTEIANNPKESPEIRSEAKAALTNK